ncbi:LysR family transcriptional regulator [Variovorax sp. LARHSF232]
MHLNLRQLEIFRAVAESGGIRAASRQLHLTQPAVTHAIRELEKAVDAQLLVRSVHGAELTDIGVRLLHRTRRLFNEVRRTQDEIVQMRDGTGGSLRIAFSWGAAMLLPDALKIFRARRPGVTLELHEQAQPDTDTRWRNGDYDFGVFSEPTELSDPLEAADGGLVRETLLEMPLWVMARTGHPHAKARSLAQLQQSTWLVPDYGRMLLQRLFAARRKPPPTDVIYCRSALLAITLLHQTDAVALMSGNPMRKQDMLSGLTRLPVPGPLAHISLSLLIRDSQALTPAAKIFTECVREASSKLR